MSCHRDGGVAIALHSVRNRQPAATVSAPPFADVPIRVSHSITSRPISGAVVSPFCMGGTPYATNTYTTDAEGIARVTFYAGASIAGVLVKMDGYETANIAVPPTNPVSCVEEDPAMSMWPQPCAAANGGGPSRLQSARLVAAVAELVLLGVIVEAGDSPIRVALLIIRCRVWCRYSLLRREQDKGSALTLLGKGFVD